MKTSTILLSLSCIFSLALADSDCATHTTQKACSTNKTCTFQPSGSYCSNTCPTLSENDCQSNAYCDYTPSSCSISFDCTSLNSESTCQANPLCYYNKPTNGSCDVKGSSLQSYCTPLTTNQATCEANSKCSFTKGTFSTCGYKPGQCSAITVKAQCTGPYCSYQQTSCYSQYQQTNNQPCSSVTSSTTCAGISDQGCTWNGSTCIDSCINITTDSSCQNSFGCAIKTKAVCNDAPSTGSTQCLTLNSESTCISNSNCQPTYSPQSTCNQVSNYCKSQTTQSNCDSTYCTFTPPPAPTCVNKVSQNTCSSQSTQTNCSNQSGCTWSTFSCVNNPSSQCERADDWNTCYNTNKFCTLNYVGTCSTEYNVITSSKILSPKVAIILTYIILALITVL